MVADILPWIEVPMNHVYIDNCEYKFKFNIHFILAQDFTWIKADPKTSYR